MRITADTARPKVAELLLHGDITGKIIGAFYTVYNELGHGFLESVYAAALEIEFQLRGIPYVREFSLQVDYKGRAVGTFRTDFFVAACVMVEVKAARVITDADRSQLLHYLKATKQEVGLLLHFGPKAEFYRMQYSHG